MDPDKSPPISFFVPTTIILLLIGGVGLALLIKYTTPNGGTRWAFFFCGVLALTGIALPVMAYLNRRFSSTPPANSTVVLRQALWVGIYIPTLIWLLIGGVLNPFMALLLAVGFALIEWLLRLRERSRWNP